MTRKIDLSYPIVTGMPVYPGDCETEVAVARELPHGGCNLTNITMCAHAGTHVDAPFHFIANGTTIDQISPDVLVGWAEVLDLGELPPDSEITDEMLDQFSPRVTPGCRLILRTGWSKRFHDSNFFTNHPNLTLPAAQWLVDRKISLLGLEQPSIHTADNRSLHEMILGADIVLVETMANLDQLTRDRVYLAALPLNLSGRDGGPARVVALEFDDLLDS